MLTDSKRISSADQFCPDVQFLQHVSQSSTANTWGLLVYCQETWSPGLVQQNLGSPGLLKRPGCPGCPPLTHILVFWSTIQLQPAHPRSPGVPLTPVIYHGMYLK